MHLLAAPDKFRGTVSAAEAAAAMGAGARARGWTCTEMALADGGEGTLEALGGPTRASTVTGPLAEPVEAVWRLVNGVAVIETARASGLLLAGGRERNDPLRATTRGTGELIKAALDLGARRVIVGVGGSASTDGGAGAVDVLDAYRPLDGSRGTEILVACDVRTLFLDAGRAFGPQKGATSEQAIALSRRLGALALHYECRYGVDVTRIVGAGAAGGLAGGLAALGAVLVGGFDLVAQEVGLVDALKRSDFVVTGEGRLDAESFNGKVVGGVTNLAAKLGVEAHVIAGAAEVGTLGRVPVTTLVETCGPVHAWAETSACIEQCLKVLLAGREPRTAEKKQRRRT